MTPVTGPTLLEMVNALGTIGVLIFFVYAFYRGDVLSKPTLERIMAMYEQKFTEMIVRVTDSVNKLYTEQNHPSDATIDRIADKLAEKLRVEDDRRTAEASRRNRHD